MAFFVRKSSYLWTSLILVINILSQETGTQASSKDCINQTPDADITASSALNSNSYPKFARLRNSKGWIADDNDKHPWMGVNLHTAINITAIATQGVVYEGYPYFVESYYLSYGDDGQNWVNYTFQGMTKVFQANVDANSIVKVVFNSSVLGKFIRIHPTNCSIRCALRMELYGCNSTGGMPGRPSPPIATSVLATSINITWSAPDYVGDGITGYNVRWEDVGASTRSQKVIVGNKSRVATLSNISPYTNYTIEVQAFNGKGDSPWSFPLTVQSSESDPPRILTQLPSELTWIEGNTQELYCAADGKPKPKVTWRKDGRKIKRGRTTAKIAFRSVSYKDEGLYQCVATNIGGKKTTEVQINILYAPKKTNIRTNAPKDTVSDGSFIIITCKALGNPPPGYKFFINGKPIRDRTAEQSGILEITAIGYGQKGIYSCRPENDRGIGPMSEVAVYVRYSPEITLHPGSKVVDENNPVGVQCEAEGFPPPLIKWVKLLGNRNVANGTSLFLPSAQRSDHGRYRCIATNGFGRDASADFNIHVYYAPKKTNIRTNAPQDTVSDGSSIIITCKALGNPPPGYKFFINGKPIRDRTAEQSGILEITAIGSGQKGIYSCRPENRIGIGPMSEVAVYVGYSPEITLHPGNKVVDENNPVGVQCEAEGFPPPLIKWVKLLGNRNVANGTSLFLPSAQRSDHGRYRCIATNGFGRDASADFNINVYYAPVINRTASSKNVPAWAGVSTNLTCVAYGNPAPRYIWRNSSGKVSASEESGILQVTPQEDGFGPYTCTVQNSKGTDNLDIRLVKAGPSHPRDLMLQVKSSTSILVSWKEPALQNGEITNYIIYYRQQDDQETEAQVTGSTFQRLLTDLKKFTTYYIKVRGKTTELGHASRLLNATTFEDLPGKPREVKTMLDDGNIYVFWEEPSNPNGIIRKYQIYCVGKREYDGAFQSNLEIPTTEDARFNVIKKADLSPGTEFTVYITAFTIKGEGSESEHMVVNTPAVAPPPPTEPQVNYEATTLHTITITIQPASDTNGKVIFHQVIVKIPGKVTKRETSTLPDNVTNYKEATRKGENLYMAARLSQDALNTSKVFVLGDGKTFGGYENVQLQPGTSYKVYIRGVTEDNGRFLYGESAEISLPPTLEDNPPSGQKSDADDTVGIIAGILGALVLIVIAIIGILLYKRNNRERNPNLDFESHKRKRRDFELKRQSE
ncbi:contactin-4-like isoform X2 [Montipora foliosa]|uniref:contactin-4-like isoform X2 n=1 Tax=Montipora foliosa TaxID=591990 RepID=UPI0035F1D372